MVLEAPVTTTRILVIEDDPNVAEVVARYLAREGYEVDVGVRRRRRTEAGAWRISPTWWCSTSCCRRLSGSRSAGGCARPPPCR